MAVITLIPETGVQFFDVELDAEALPRLTRAFLEETTGDGRVKLRELKENKDGTLHVEETGAFADPDSTYAVGRNQAFEMHLDRWVPLPYLRARPTGPGGGTTFDKGPSNWARARLALHPDPRPGRRTHALTLAFDTGLTPRTADNRYVGPTPEDSGNQGEFAFAPASRDNSWLLDEAWMETWLAEMLAEFRFAKRRGRPPSDADADSPRCEHYARYLTFLALLDAAEVLPRVRLLHAISESQGFQPVAVDLVLDVGNARTCGILIEEHPDQGVTMADSYELVLRDLSRPELSYGEPFDSRVEFSRAAFGRDTVARRSGRAGSFGWPSPVRVGPEAVRLAGSRVGNEGISGLSSPKRYLWDERRSTQNWRFNGRSADGATTDPPVTGSFMTLVDEAGRVLRPGQGQFAVQASFSRSAMFTFMLAEILLQALSQVNAPGNRSRRRDADKPRRLRSVVLTMPPGMPVAEQDILRSRAEAAVRLAWSMLGWTDRAQPAIRCTLDEATATQIVWLHNEVSERLQGDAAGLMAMLGRQRTPGPAGNSLRVASIDIGGGTTDLMVTTFGMEGEVIVPRQEFRESFKIAGDDVLERVVAAAVLPCLEKALVAAGVADARALLARTLTQDVGGQDEKQRHLRRLFVSSVLEPLGIAILAAYEAAHEAGGPDAGGEVLRGSVATLLGPTAGTAVRAFAYLDDAALAAGGRGFRSADVVVTAEGRRVGGLVKTVLDPVLADLCEVVWHYDCDVLLLSGRPSRLRAVQETVLAKAPVPPHRLIGMHRYRVGDRYPFRDASNRIEDPKTTAVVGAALCVQAEGRLRNFVLRTRGLSMRSTARFIGRMLNGGQITSANELMTNLDLDGPATEEDVGFTTTFSTTTQIGFRQLPVERWTATPLYVMELTQPENASRLRMPLTIRVVRTPPRPAAHGGADEDDATARERFRIEEITDGEGDPQPSRLVRLQLQTMADGEGYWRDTGRLSQA